MISEPEPTDVMPTSSPPTAPTSRVGTGFSLRVVLAQRVAAGDVAQLEVHPQRVGRRGEQQRVAQRLLEEVLLAPRRRRPP